jgi:hypothetical protein
MAINIQEQFSVNIALPIDSRIVASGSADRLAIPNKYDGLIVYDTAERKTYVWNAVSNSFILSDISGGGTINGLAKWTSASGLTSSGIYMISGVGSANGRVGINTSSPNEVLQINSITAGSQPFVIHKGTVNNIIGSNWYNTGSDAYNSISVGSNIIKFASNGETLFLNRVNGNVTALNSSDGYNSFTTANFGPDRINLHRNTVFNNSALGSIQSAPYIRSRFLLSTKTSPDYTWWNDDMTGIYHPIDNKIGFSIEGEQKMILTLNGLAITGSDNVTSPSSRLHLDSGNSTSTYIQFTSGSLTGFGSNTGVLMGINSAGYPVFQSRYQNSPYLFVFSSGNSHHAIRRNKLVTYSWTNGENFSSVSASNGGNGSRTERISIEFADSNASGSISQTIYTLEIPNDTYLSYEATFTTTLDPASQATQFKSQKIFGSVRCDSSGNVTIVGTSTVIATVSGSAANGIGNGSVGSTLVNSLNFNQTIGVSGTHNTYVVLDIIAVFNVNVGL